MEEKQTMFGDSPDLKIGFATIGVAAACTTAILLLGWPLACFLGMVMLGALLYGWVSVLSGLRQRSNRQGWRLWIHIGLLVAMPVLLYLGDFFHLLDVRARVAVASTGGQDELQAWAVALLNQPRDRVSSDEGSQRMVPPENWSEQVRRLKPGRVFIEPLFENEREGVCLTYGSGFFHWQIVIGPPGSRPDPRLDDPNSNSFWYRWGDGIYDWQQR